MSIKKKIHVCLIVMLLYLPIQLYSQKYDPNYNEFYLSEMLKYGKDEYFKKLGLTKEIRDTLQQLTIGGYDFFGDSIYITSNEFPKLKILELRVFCSFFTLKGLGDFKNIQELKIGVTETCGVAGSKFPFIDLSEVYKLKKLKKLSINGMLFCDLYKLSTITTLQEIEIANFRNIEAEQLINLPNISKIIIENTKDENNSEIEKAIIAKSYELLGKKVDVIPNFYERLAYTKIIDLEKSKINDVGVTIFYVNGTLACEGKFLNKKRVGIWNYYYKNGTKSGFKKYDTLGFCIEKQVYEDNEKNYYSYNQNIVIQKNNNGVKYIINAQDTVKHILDTINHSFCFYRTYKSNETHITLITWDPNRIFHIGITDNRLYQFEMRNVTSKCYNKIFMNDNSQNINHCGYSEAQLNELQQFVENKIKLFYKY